MAAPRPSRVTTRNRAPTVLGFFSSMAFITPSLSAATLGEIRAAAARPAATAVAVASYPSEHERGLHRTRKKRESQERPGLRHPGLASLRCASGLGPFGAQWGRCAHDCGRLRAAA